MTNSSRDKFLTAYTGDLVKTIKQFHQPGYSRNYLDAEMQDCFLLVMVQYFDHPFRAMLESSILSHLTDHAIKNKIAAANPSWRSLNMDVLQADPGWSVA